MLTRAKRVAVGALTVMLTGTLASCQSLGGGLIGQDAKPSGTAGAVPGPNEITASRTGILQGTGTEARFRVDIYRVERYEDYSMLRFAVTNLEDSSWMGQDIFAATRVDGTFSSFQLVDPVGRRIYYSLRQGDSMGGAFGSWAGTSVDFQPGVRYRGVVYFPPLPQGTKRITVLGPDTSGEFTGIPVVRGSGAPAANSAVPTVSPKPGSPVKLPTTGPPSGDVWSVAEGLYAITDSSSARSNVSSPGKQKVSLRADVLFAFDSAKLSDEAKAVVREVAPEITKRADPTKPITFEGHTDNVGDTAYNKDLSRRRAKAVHKELTAALGGSASSYKFEVTGKGETEPIADNAYEDGRARNRRVEIEYATKPPATAATPAPGSSGPPGDPVIGAPAPFHAKDGPVVATRTTSVEPVGSSAVNMKLTVHPFYRDGAYLVGVFEIAADQTFVGGFDTPEMIGAAFGSFTIVDPTTQNRYYEVRIGKSDDSIYYVDSGGLLLDGGDSGRHFAYYPAPPAGVKSVTFDAGPFGTIKNVPIRR